jgi:hypothetical protein
VFFNVDDRERLDFQNETGKEERESDVIGLMEMADQHDVGGTLVELRVQYVPTVP